MVCHAPWADFVAAVLDGHNGKLAAETCSKRIVPLISEELAKLELSKPSPKADDGEASSAHWHPQVRVARERSRRGTAGGHSFQALAFGPSLAFASRARPGRCTVPPPPALPLWARVPPRAHVRARAEGAGSAARARLGESQSDSPPRALAQLENAITAAFKRLDKDIRAAVPDGTTAGLVVLKRSRDGATQPRAGVATRQPHLTRLASPPAGGLNAKCAWVGDSRAVLALYGGEGSGRGVEVLPLSRDHKATDPIESARIEAFYHALDKISTIRTGGGPDQKGSNDSNSTGSEGSDRGESRRGSGADMLRQARADLGVKGRGDSSGEAGHSQASQKGSEAALEGTTMCEELSESFGRAFEFDPTMLGLNVSRDAEGSFVVNLPGKGATRRNSEGSNSLRGGTEGFQTVRTGGAGPSPAPASEHSMRRASIGEGSGSGKGSVENSRHGPSPLASLSVPRPPIQHAHGALGALGPPPLETPEPSASAPPPPSGFTPAVLAAAEKAAAEAPSRGRRSFVGRLRDASTGNMSNPRLFGGSVGASTAMTRSIGDRGAARCCIAEPEFLTRRVAPGQAARIIIASDGVWDVYANDEAETIAKGTRMDGARTSAACAQLLARRAQEDRSFDGLSPDDITVVVLDVHGGGLAGGAEGGCCALQ